MNGQAIVFPSYLFTNILVGLTLAFLFGWLSIRLAKRLGLVDVPGVLPHKKHDVTTPLAGGMALVASVLAGGLLVGQGAASTLWRILLPGLLIFAFGLWDDFKRLPPWIKLIGQCLASILLISFGVYAQVLQPGFLGLQGPLLTWGNWFITVFWMVGITNAMNLIDSMDGIVIGTSGIALAFMILVGLIGSQDPLLELMTLMLGVCMGLYFYNATPARLFLGDSGAQTFGFWLAAIAILFTPGQRPLLSSWFVPILILGLPIFDTSMVTFSRLWRRIPIYKAGRDHTYHRLVSLGLDNKRAVMVMHLITIVMGCIAFIALGQEPLVANAIFASVCLAGGLLIAWLGIRKKNEPI